MTVAVGIDEHLEIIITKNYGVVMGQGRPDLRLFQFGRYVKVLIVPQHLGARAEARLRLIVSLDVREVPRPGCLLPIRFVQPAINHDRPRGVMTLVALWHDELHSRPIAAKIPLCQSVAAHQTGKGEENSESRYHL